MYLIFINIDVKKFKNNVMHLIYINIAVKTQTI